MSYFARLRRAIWVAIRRDCSVRAHRAAVRLLYCNPHHSAIVEFGCVGRSGQGGVGGGDDKRREKRRRLMSERSEKQGLGFQR